MEKNRVTRLHYVFDIINGQIIPFIWQYKDDFSDQVIADIADNFNIDTDTQSFEKTIEAITDGRLHQTSFRPTINALETSITHFANILYTIDPNVEDGFYCQDIKIQNNSKVPVKISLEALRANSNGDLVLPDTMVWNSLNRQETKTYIALGYNMLMLRKG